MEYLDLSNLGTQPCIEQLFELYIQEELRSALVSAVNPRAIMSVLLRPCPMKNNKAKTFAKGLTDSDTHTNSRVLRRRVVVCAK